MAEALTMITDILEEECSLYRDMLGLSEKKTDIIKEGQVAELEKMIKVEQSMIIKIGRLEEVREKLSASLIELHQLEGLTISSLEALAEGELKGRIGKVRLALEELVGKLKHTNRVNEQLLKNNLEYVDYFLDMYTGQNVSGGTYAKDGQVPAKQQKINMFDRKA